MQEDARCAKAVRFKSESGLSEASSFTPMNFSAPVVAPFSATAGNPISSDFCFRPPFQTKGWAEKAPEFINSGPPALLNNPCCSRRVVIDPFLKHAMEVHYG
jgi:hypothetical protein